MESQNKTSISLQGSTIEAMGDTVEMQDKDSHSILESKPQPTLDTDWLRHIKPSPFCEEYKQKQIHKLAGENQPPAETALSCEVVVVNDVITTDTTTSDENNHNPTTAPMKEVLIVEGTDLNDLDSACLPSFPTLGLPKILRDMTEHGAYVYGVPLEFMAAYLLSATAAALRKRIVLKDKYSNFPQLWLMVVANSGIGKSEPMRVAFDPLYKRDKLANEVYQQEMLQWQADCAEVQQSKKKSEKVEMPPKPIYKQMLISDTTPEALYQAIKVNNGVTLCRDELSGWFSDFGRYAKSGEVGHYLSIFNNSQMQINRKSEEPNFIATPYLSIVGGIQPKILTDSINTKGMYDNGFPQRFIYVYPDNVLKKEYIDAQMPPDILCEYETFINILCDCDEMEVAMNGEAKAIFRDFANEMTAKVNATDADYLKAMYSKMEIHLSRLALTIYNAKLITGETDEATINAEIMTYCTELCRYFVATGEKVYRLIATPNLPQREISNGELLRQLGKRYDVKSQTKLAEALGVSQQAISKELKK